MIIFHVSIVLDASVSFGVEYLFYHFAQKYFLNSEIISSATIGSNS